MMKLYFFSQKQLKLKYQSDLDLHCPQKQLSSELNSTPNNDSKIEFLGKGRNCSGKRRKCWLKAFFYFHKMLSKISFLRFVITCDMWSRSTIFSTYEFFTKQQSLRLVQIEYLCRQQNKCNLKTEILFWDW